MATEDRLGVQEKITLTALLDEVKKDYEINRRKSSERIKSSRKHLVTIIGEDRPIEEITEPIIEDYKHQRKHGFSPLTTNWKAYSKGYGTKKSRDKLIRPIYF